GAGRSIFLGFDAWYRAWTTQEERLVLNAALYPRGTAIAPGAAAPEGAAAARVPAAKLPSVASRPVHAQPSGRRRTGLRSFRTRRERKLTYEIRTCIAAIVEIAITAPVTE